MPSRQASCLALLWRARLRGRRLSLIPTFRAEDGEDRYKVIGMVDGKFWTAVHVRHGDIVRFMFGQEKRRWRRKAVFA